MFDSRNYTYDELIEIQKKIAADLEARRISRFNTAVSKLILKLTAINSSAFTITKISALLGLIFPAGISRSAVRGFSPSIL